jgi:hypothetical protein
MTEADELADLGFYRVPDMGPVFYCYDCAQMFWFDFDRSVKQAMEHQRICPADGEMS